MARLGLDSWRTAFANDLDPVKIRAYAANFGTEHLVHANVWTLGAGDLPTGRAGLAWASSPCQDLSLAGARGGLSARRSGAFWGFWRLIEALDAENRAPRLIVIENVLGLLTSRGGEDFRALCDLLAAGGWRFGALEMDAAHWLPQSRPRLFVVATRGEGGPVSGGPVAPFHSRGVVTAWEGLSASAQAAWRWWRLPAPPLRNTDLATVLEADDAVDWLDDAQAQRLLSLMSPLHRQRLDGLLAARERRVGAAYRRVRREAGERAQRLEVRFDGLAGCLRTPAGGSSRQFVIVAEDGRVRARLLTAREALRLMGVPDGYDVPGPDGAALKVAGDGVAVPVVRALSDGLLLPLLGRATRAAA